MERTILYGAANEPLSGTISGGGLAPPAEEAHDNAGPSRRDDTGPLDLTRYERQGQEAPVGRARGYKGPSQAPWQRDACEKWAGQERQGAQLLLAAVPRGVSLSRQLVRQMCLLSDLDAVADVAELLASEVVTNGVRHAVTTCLEVVVEVGQGQLRVSVVDKDSTVPIMRQGNVEALGGRGLHLLDRLADSWGVTELQDGKEVWFTLSVAPS
jgi:anti-sigma regulatory factor (Ser/Thr protein kinase)